MFDEFATIITDSTPATKLDHQSVPFKTYPDIS